MWYRLHVLKFSKSRMISCRKNKLKWCITISHPNLMIYVYKNSYMCTILWFQCTCDHHLSRKFLKIILLTCLISCSWCVIVYIQFAHFYYFYWIIYTNLLAPLNLISKHLRPLELYLQKCTLLNVQYAFTCSTWFRYSRNLKGN